MCFDRIFEGDIEERKGRWSNCKIFWLGVGEGQFNDMVSLFLIVE